MEKLKSGAARLGINLSGEQLEKFETYYREIIDWNKKVNLTRITDYEEVQLKHFLDSLSVLTVVPPDKALRVIDVGTGAGLPGLPLKIVSPDIDLTLLEAAAKKTRFLDHVIARLGLDRVTVVTGRAEAIARDTRYREKFDLALARALAPLPALAELALPFCRVGGCCIAPKKGEVEGEVARALKAIEMMGGSLREVKPVRLAELSDNRFLVIIDKVKPAPTAYPRRPGMPAKRPLLP
jgi:16S rRNA (guanine527-N7)-methyltransferase